MLDRAVLPLLRSPSLTISFRPGKHGWLGQNVASADAAAPAAGEPDHPVILQRAEYLLLSAK